MRAERVQPGSPISNTLSGAILTRDLVVAGQRWPKGRKLSAADLAALEREAGRQITVLVPDANDVHEDDAGRRLAAAVAGPGLVTGDPVQSRIDLRAAVDGVLHIRTQAVDRLNRIDAIEVFTALDGRVVSNGDLVASVKIAPHLVPEAVLAQAEAVAARSGPVVRIAAFRPSRVAVVVKETVRGVARERFEASVRSRVEGLGSTLVGIDYVADDEAAVEAAMARRLRARRRDRADLLMTAGSASTDPGDPFFVAIERLGGRMIRHGVPAHPGSMLWLARVGRVPILGLPSCGAYSKATAADLLLPRLLSGEPASAATVARLGHGGLLTRDQRFRFPPYAREMDAPEG
ncbi:MAG: molybdopterin-binding protein [Chloroflexi bacterium]|nr:molybdopterin-binding protein [Chloroflexota bacterium]